MRWIGSLIVLSVALALGSSTPSLAADVVSEWTTVPLGGLWSDGANWSTDPVFPDNVPGTTFDARILVDADIELDREIEVERFEYFGRLLHGAGSITVTDHWVWNAGRIDLDGSLVTEGTSTIGRIPGGFGVEILNGTLDNRGALTFSQATAASAAIRLFGTGTIVNRAGATWIFDGEGDIDSNTAQLAFTNEGTLRRLPVPGQTDIIGTALNTGLIEIQGGQLAFRVLEAGQTGLTNQGLIRVDAGASLWMRGTAAPGSRIEAAGDVRLSSVEYAGSLDVSGLTTAEGTTFTSTDLSFGGGLLVNETSFLGGLEIDELTLVGPLEVQGDLTVNGAFDWRGGLSTTGSATLRGVSTADTGAAILAGTVLNLGTFDVVGSLSVEEGSRLINPAGQTIDATSTTTPGIGGQGTISNAGLFRISGSNVVGRSIHPAFDNEGTLELLQGRVGLIGGGSSTGEFHIAAGSQLNFLGNHMLAASSSVAGEGTTVFGGFGSHTIVDGAIQVAKVLMTSDIEIDFNGSFSASEETTVGSSGSTARFLGPVLDLGALVVDGGTAHFVSTAPALEALRMTAGNRSGGTMFRSHLIVAGDLDVDGLFDWSGGTLSGPGVTDARGGLTMSASGLGSQLTLDGRTLRNSLDATFTRGPLELLNGAVFENPTGSTLSVGGLFPRLISSDGSGSLLNEGSFRSTSGSPEISVNFSNRGTVEVADSTLGLRGVTTNENRITVGAGGRLEIGGGFNGEPASVISGSGSVTFSAFAANLLGSYDLQGTTTLRSGSVSFGAANQSLGSQLTMSGGRGTFVTPASVGNVGGTRGTLEVVGTTLTATGDFTASTARVLLDDGAVSFGSMTFGFDTSRSGSLQGNGVVEADVLLQGAIVFDREQRALLSPGLAGGVGSLTIAGDMTLSGGKISILLGGQEQGAEYDFVSIGGAGVLEGVLEVFVGGDFESEISPDDMFTVLTAGGPLSGSFENVANGNRLMTANGRGSFVVNYGAGSAFDPVSVVLTSFVPEPSTSLLLGGGLLVLGLRKRQPTGAQILKSQARS